MLSDIIQIADGNLVSGPVRFLEVPFDLTATEHFCNANFLSTMTNFDSFLFYLKNTMETFIYHPRIF